MATAVGRWNQADPMTGGEALIWNALRSSPWLQDEAWTLLDQPHINDVKPDFILTHPLRGGIMIEVKDWALHDRNRYRDGCVLGNDGRWHNVNPAGQLRRQQNALTSIGYLIPGEMAQQLFDEGDQELYRVFSPVLYFHGSARADVLRFLNGTDQAENGMTVIPLEDDRQFKCYVWTDEDAENLRTGNDPRNYRIPMAIRWRGVQWQCRWVEAHGQPAQQYITRMTQVLSGSDFEHLASSPAPLTQEQQACTAHKAGAVTFIAGMTGSGKTLVLAQRAADACRAGRSVLIVTKQITQLHSLHDAVRRQYHSTTPRENLQYNHLVREDNYHNLLRGLCRLSQETDTDAHSFEETSAQVNAYTSRQLAWLRSNPDFPQYRSIDDVYVDSAEALRSEDLLFLRDSLWSGRGEFVVTFDATHRMLTQGLDNGKWLVNQAEFDRLDFTRRLFLQTAVSMPARLYAHLERLRALPDSTDFTPQFTPRAQLPDIPGHIRWVRTERNGWQQHAAEQILQYAQENALHPEDLLIITSGYQSAQELGKRLRALGLPLRICGEQKAEKNSFWNGRGQAHISAAHNLAGWHASHVILVIGDTDLTPQILYDNLYRSMTRVVCGRSDAQCPGFSFIVIDLTGE